MYLEGESGAGVEAADGVMVHAGRENLHLRLRCLSPVDVEDVMEDVSVWEARRFPCDDEALSDSDVDADCLRGFGDCKDRMVRGVRGGGGGVEG